MASALDGTNDSSTMPLLQVPIRTQMPMQTQKVTPKLTPKLTAKLTPSPTGYQLSSRRQWLLRAARRHGVVAIARATLSVVLLLLATQQLLFMRSQDAGLEAPATVATIPRGGGSAGGVAERQAHVLLLSRGRQPSDLDTLPAAIAVARSALKRQQQQRRKQQEEARGVGEETGEGSRVGRRGAGVDGRAEGVQEVPGVERRGESVSAAARNGRSLLHGDGREADAGNGSVGGGRRESGGGGEGAEGGDGEEIEQGDRGEGAESAEGATASAVLSVASGEAESAAAAAAADTAQAAGKEARRRVVAGQLRQCLLAVQAYMGAAVEFRDNSMAEQSRREMTRCLLLLASPSALPLLDGLSPLLTHGDEPPVLDSSSDALQALQSSAEGSSSNSGGSSWRNSGGSSSGRGRSGGDGDGERKKGGPLPRGRAFARLEQRLQETGRQADAVVRQSLLFSHVASTAVPAPLHCLSLRLTLAAHNTTLHRTWLSGTGLRRANLDKRQSGLPGLGGGGGAKAEQVGGEVLQERVGGVAAEEGGGERGTGGGREREWRRQQLEDPDLFHYVVITDNVLAAMVVVNSTASHAREPWRHVVHVVTDRSNHPAFIAWFSANPPAHGQMAWEVLCFEDFPWLASVPLLQHLQRPALRDFYFHHAPANAFASLTACKPATAAATASATPASPGADAAAAAAAAAAAGAGAGDDADALNSTSNTSTSSTNCSSSSSSSGGDDLRTLRFRNPKYVSLFNHLRFYLPQIFPRLHTLLFLDDDTVVQQDLSFLWQLPRGGAVNLAVPTCGRTYHRFRSYLNFSHPLLRHQQEQQQQQQQQPEVPSPSSPLPPPLHATVASNRTEAAWKEQSVQDGRWSTSNDTFSSSSSSGGGVGQVGGGGGGGGLDPNGCAWAFGFNLFDLRAWRQGNYTEKYHFWLQQNENRTLWQLGTLPAGLLTFLHATRPLPRSLLAASLGSRSTLPVSRVREAAVLHYNGHAKPWLDLGFPEYAGFWWRYVPVEHPLLQACYLYPPGESTQKAPFL